MCEVLKQMSAGCLKRQQAVLTAQNQNRQDKIKVLARPRGLRAGATPGLLTLGCGYNPDLCLCATSSSASLLQGHLQLH